MKKIKLSADFAVIGGIFAVMTALCLRFYQLGFFEFKGEQAGNIMHGLLARERFFLIDHGLETSVGVPNTALFYQWCGVLSFFSVSPAFFAAVSLLSGILGTVLLYFAVRKTIGTHAALTAVLIAFCTPFILFLSSNIWPQVYLVLAVPVLLWGLGRKDACGWVIAVLTAVLAGMIHFSGFFLGPGLLWIAWWRRIGWKPVLLAGAVALLLLSPWLHHLFFEWNRVWFPAPDGFAGRPFSLLWETFGMFGPGFLKEYFGRNLMAPAGRFCGRAAAWGLAGMALLPVWYGIITALRHWREAPETVRDAVILVISSLLGYMVLLVHVYFFYLFPAAILLAVTAGYGFSLMPRRIRRWLLTIWCIGALGITGLTQFAMDCGGGHPQEYGPSYRFWQEVRQELRSMMNGRKIALQIRSTDRAKGKLDPAAVWFLLKEEMSPAGIPVLMLLDFDVRHQRYIRQYQQLRSGTVFSQNGEPRKPPACKLYEDDVK